MKLSMKIISSLWLGTHKADSVHSYGSGQSHLGKYQKQFSILNLQYVKTGLSYDVDILCMLRHTKQQQIDSVISRILTVWSLLFAPNILSANQTDFMYNISRMAQCFSYCARHFSIMIETN